jgi:hypothetical protein
MKTGPNALSTAENESGSTKMKREPEALGDGDQIMAGLHMNNHDQGSKFWTSSQFEEPGPSHIYN